MSRNREAKAIASGTTNGCRWYTLRAPIYGAVNGYIHIPDGSPLKGMDYSDINDVLWTMEKEDRTSVPDLVGGANELTYAVDDVVGFDTLHAWDVWPGDPFGTASEPGAILWTPELVAEECKKWAQWIGASVGMGIVSNVLRPLAEGGSRGGDLS